MTVWSPCVNAAEFDAFVAASPYGHVHQSFEWGEVKSAFGWKPLRLMAAEGGRTVGAVSLLKTWRCGVPILYASRGPVLDYGEPALVSRLVPALKEVARREGALFLRVSPAVSSEDAAVAGALRAGGFMPTAKPLQHTATTYLRLSGRRAEEVLASFEKETRYSIRVAARKGVEVERAAGEGGVAEFHALLQKTGARKHVAFFPLEFYQTVFALLAPKGMASVYLARVAGRPVAAVFILRFAGKAWYMWGGFDYEFRDYMPNHALQWAAIQDALASGLSTYDFQGIPAGAEVEKALRGVRHFKMGFRGETARWLGEWDVPGRLAPVYRTANRLGVV